MEGVTHFWCQECRAIAAVTFEPIRTISTDGQYRSGDITCNECGYVIAVMFKERE